MMKIKMIIHTILNLKVSRPIIVTRKGYVVDGNDRLYIAKLLKLTVDVIIVC